MTQCNFWRTKGLIKIEPKAERRHRTIVGIGRLVSLNCFIAKFPTNLGFKAFKLSFTSLIEDLHLPCQIMSLYLALFGKQPDYSSMRVFGCKCYPCLRHLTSHKLQPRSLPCLFIGHKSTYEGYLCYHILSENFYLSRHVIFDEHAFPFATSDSSPLPLSPNLSLTTYMDFIPIVPNSSANIVSDSSVPAATIIIFILTMTNRLFAEPSTNQFDISLSFQSSPS